MTKGADGVVAVDGAEGFLGGAVVDALLREGRGVRALVFDVDAKAALSRWPDGVEVVAVPRGALPDGLLHGACAVVAARRISCERPREGLTYRLAQTERTKGLLAEAARAGVKRFVYAGLAGVDGRARSRLAEAEREVKTHMIGSPVPALYLNLPMVVGPGDEVVSRMVGKAKSIWPVVTFIGQGWTRAAPMTRDDFGGCAARLAVTDDFPTGELDLAGPEKLSVMEIQDRLLRLAGRRKVKVHIMASVAVLGAWITERVLSAPPVTLEGVRWMLEERVPKRNAARTLLGRRPEAFERAFPELDVQLPEEAPA